MTASHVTRRQFVKTAAAACAAPFVIRARRWEPKANPPPVNVSPWA